MIQLRIIVLGVGCISSRHFSSVWLKTVANDNRNVSKLIRNATNKTSFFMKSSHPVLLAGIYNNFSFEYGRRNIGRAPCRRQVIRSRPLPLLAKGLFDERRCWLFGSIWSCVSAWRDLLGSLMGYCLESRRCRCGNERRPTAVPLSGLHGDGLMVFHNALLMRRWTVRPETRQSPFNAHNYTINQT